MLPTTKETNNRIKNLTHSTYTISLDDGAESQFEPSDTFQSYDGTFLSSEFQDMYKSETAVTNVTTTQYSWVYPFEKELSTDVTNISKTFQLDSKPCTAYICLYRICKGSNSYPYLQYKLKVTSKKNATLKKYQMCFPSISYKLTTQFKSNDVTGLIKHADDYVSNTIGCERFEFKGLYHLDLQDPTNGEKSNPVYSGMAGGRGKVHKKGDSSSSSSSSSGSDSDSDSDSDSQSDSSRDSYFESSGHYDNCELYLFYYDTTSEAGTSNVGPISVTSKTEWWWACVHEMFNTKRILHYRVGSNVTSLFIRQPIALFLVNSQGIIYETPHVLYKGLPSGTSLSEMCKFGPRIRVDDNNVSIERKKHLMKKNINEIPLHGSYYYFYDYCDAIRGACYTYDDDNDTYQKNESAECYLFRYVVFLGRLKVFMYDNMNAATNHVPIRTACLSRETNWPLSGYDSMYHGKYVFTRDGKEKHKNLYPSFSVCDPHTFLGITYHKVDMTSVSSQLEDILKRKKYLKFK